MSISDGQIVLQEATSSSCMPPLNIAASLSRMGTRAYYPALQQLAPQVPLQQLLRVQL
jgi:F0F1-type ATP synthase alpha subunit